MNTKITINQGTSDEDRLKLNLAELEENVEYTKLAFCTKVEIGNTYDGNPFFKFYLLDRFGRKTTGRLFNAENTDDAGKKLNAYIGHVVSIDFRLSMFGNSKSLTIEGISPVSEDLITREDFIGEIPGVDESHSHIITLINNIPETYMGIKKLFDQYNLKEGIELISIPELYGGRKGGAVTFASALLHTVNTVFMVDDENRDEAITLTLLTEIFMSWKYKCDYEETVLSLGDNLSTTLAKAEQYIRAVEVHDEKVGNRKEKNLCEEAKHLLRCYFGFDKPQTYLTNVLVGLRTNLTEMIELKEKNDSMIEQTYQFFTKENGDSYKLIKL